MKYSITIPAYKAKYLKEAIDSILAQTYQDFEIIIVNDDSPEDLDTIVKAYSDPRIRYFKNEKNCGALHVVDNWNICLSKSQGDFVICMGDDDKLKPECLAVYNDLMEKHPGLDVYHGWTEIIDEQSQVFDMQEARPEYEGVYSALWHRMKGRCQFIGDFLFRTAPLRDAGGFYFVPMAWGSDDITALRAMIGKGVANTQQPVFQYRVNSQTISSSCHSDTKMEGFMMMADWCRNLINRDCPNENSVEAVFHKTLKTLFDEKFRGRQKTEIIENLRGGDRISKIIFWYRNRKRFELGKKELFICFMKSFNKGN